MSFPYLVAGFKTLSLTAKIGIGVALLVLLLIVAGGTRSCVSSYKDKQADKKQAELKAEGDEHRKRADEAEAKAKELEGKIAVQELIIKAAGQKAEAAAQKVQDETKKFEDEMAAIGAPIDPCERVKRICVRLAIKPADCTCTSN